MSDSGKPEQHPQDASPVSPSLQTPQAIAGGSFHPCQHYEDIKRNAPREPFLYSIFQPIVNGTCGLCR